MTMPTTTRTPSTLTATATRRRAAGRHPKLRILGIAGALRTGSYNRLLLRTAGALLPTDVHLLEWDDLRAIPPFKEDDEDDAAPAVHRLRAAITAADAVLLVTPEYNGSLPGQLKNALDWASRPFPDNALRDKPVAVMGASPSPGGASRARAEARTVLARIGARVLEDEVRVARAYQQFDPAGQLVDQDLNLALGHLLERLVAIATTEPRAAVA